MVRGLAQRKRVEKEIRDSAEVSAIMASNLDLLRVFDWIADEVKKLVPFDAASIHVLTDDGNAIQVVYQSAEGSTTNQEGDVIPLEGSATARVLRDQSTEIEMDLVVEPRNASGERDFLAGYRSTIRLPLSYNEICIGCLVIRSRHANAFGSREQTILERLALKLGPAVENARLYSRLEVSLQEISRQQAELRRVQEFTERMIVNMPAAMLVVKPNLEVVFANKACYRVLGLGKRKIEGTRLSGLLHLSSVKPLVTAILKSRGPFKEREVIYRHPRKGRRWLRISASRLHGRERGRGDGKAAHLILFLDDVTEWRQTQEKLQETSRLISLGEIVGGVAHELNNLLTSVMGFAQLLVEQEPEGANRAELEMICSEAQRATKVVGKLLSFARKHKAEKGLVDLASTIERVLALKSYDLRTSNVEIDTYFAPDLPQVFADEHQLEQVFLNIVTNAQQAMAVADRRGHLLIQVRRNERMVRISFADNGPGIPANHLKSVFDLFSPPKSRDKVRVLD